MEKEVLPLERKERFGEKKAAAAMCIGRLITTQPVRMHPTSPFL